MEELAKSVVGLGPFQVCLGNLSTMNSLAETYPEATRLLAGYPNAKNVIFLIPEEGHDAILNLKRHINSALDRVTALVEYPPFLTLGQTLSDADYARALAQFADYHPALRFTAASFDLLQQTKSGHWETIHRFLFPG